MMKKIIAVALITLFSASFGYADNTKLLIHGNETSSWCQNCTFVESSASTHPVTITGDLQAVNSPSVDDGASQNGFGEAVHFDGSGDYLSIPDSEDWNFGMDDFTIDFWLRPNTLEDNANIFAQRQDSQNFNLLFVNSNTLLWFVYYNSTKICEISVPKPALNQWSHIALVKNNDIFTFYINGEAKGIDSYPGTLGNLTAPFLIGYRNVGSTYNGYMDEFRISKGIARTQDATDPLYDPEGDGFVPPASPYGASSGIQTNYLSQVSNTSAQTFSETEPVSILFDKEELTAPSFDLVSTNPTGIEVADSGIYQITYSLSYMSTDLGNDARRNARTFVYKNNDPTSSRIQSSIAYGYARGDTNSSDAPITTSNATFFVQLDSGDTIHLYAEAVGDWINGNAATLPNECWMTILRIE
ncbi:MAG: LamG domain-containing protein [Desulfobacterales bacterium]|nr:LamG domain-containing protein [Desulfobacterales bacterium]